MEIAPRTLDHTTLLEMVLENSPLGITVLSVDLRYVLVSRYSREELIQLPESEILGRHCYDLVGMYANDPERSGLERACDACPALRAMATGRPTQHVRKIHGGS